MAGSYKDLEREFRGMDAEYREYLGLIGLRHVVNDTADALERRGRPSRPVENDNFDSVGRFKNNMDDSLNDYSGNQDTDLTENTIVSLVDRMRMMTFKFKIMNAMEEIITPLKAEMERISFEEQQLKLKHHTEDNLYQQAIVGAIESMSKNVEGSLIRNLVMEYQRFTRHPVWSSLRYLNAGLIQPVASGIKTILFGWKKEKSDTDRIVESINELTEFMMTGQIDRTESFMDKYIRKGLVQSMGERLAGLAGFSKAGAQRHEDRLSMGQGRVIDAIKDAYAKGGVSAISKEDMQKLQDSWSAVFFKDIVKKGRLLPAGGNDNNLFTPNPYQSEMLSLTRMVVHNTEQIAKTNALLLLGAMESAVNIDEFFKDYDRTMFTVSELVTQQQTDSLTHVLQVSNNSFIKAHKEQMEMQEMLLDSSESVEKYTKDTAKRTRRGFSGLMALIGASLIGAIASLGGTLLGGLAKIFPWIGKGGSGGNKGGTTTGKKQSRLGGAAKGILRAMPWLTLADAFYDTFDSTKMVKQELDARNADLVERGLELSNHMTRGIIGSVIDGTTRLGAMAFDFVTGGNSAKELQEQFSNGFINRLKNSPNFPFFGSEWWGGVFDRVLGGSFWTFEGSYVDSFVKKIGDSFRKLDDVQFNRSIKAIENVDAMYDSMNDLFTPVNTKKPKSQSKPEVVQDIGSPIVSRMTDELSDGMLQLRQQARAMVEQQDTLTKAAYNNTKDHFNDQANMMVEFIQATDEFTQANKELRDQIKSLDNRLKNDSQTPRSFFGIDTDSLLNKIGI